MTTIHDEAMTCNEMLDNLNAMANNTWDDRVWAVVVALAKRVRELERKVEVLRQPRSMPKVGPSPAGVLRRKYCGPRRMRTTATPNVPVVI